jgi:phosphoglycolate phosphatase-like HAD superfamily hydrolase
MIRHLIWDMDGTLFDTYPAFTTAFLAVLADYGHYREPEMVIDLARVGLSHCAAALAEAYQLSHSALVQGFSLHYSEIPFTQQPLMPGGQALCANIVSLGGKNVIVTHRQRRSTIGLLEAHGLGTLIADSITGDDGFPKKPDPTGMQVIMARNGIVAHEGLAIGDRVLDIVAGHAAGLRTCLLGEVDSQVQPDYRVDHLDEILKFIQQENLTV